MVLNGKQCGDLAVIDSCRLLLVLPFSELFIQNFSAIAVKV